MMTVPFLNTLANSCTGNATILSDGTTRSFFGRIRDFILRKEASDYLLDVCHKLAEAMEDNKLGNLDSQRHLDILVRLKNAAFHVKNSEKKATCLGYLQKYENAFYAQDHLNRNILACDILERINQMARSLFLSSKARDREIQKLHNVLSHCDDKEKEVVYRIWKKYQVDEKSIVCRKYFRNLHIKLLQEFPFSKALVDKIFWELEDAHLRKIRKLLEEFSTIQGNPQEKAQWMRQLDHYLHTHVFSKSFALSEVSHRTYDTYNLIFLICNENLQYADREVQRRLKIKCANLPLPKGTDRKAFPNLILSKREQCQELVAYFQQMEDQIIEELMQQKHYYQGDVACLNQWVEKGRLSATKRDFVIRGLSKKRKHSFSMRSKICTKLKRCVKAKMFFEDQLQLEESRILIPSWYHATSSSSQMDICRSKQINVTSRNKNGAWVSTEPEYSGFGSYLFVFDQSIDEIDEHPAIHCTYETKRWRGLQKKIPLQENALVYIAIGSGNSKKTRKKIKTDLKEVLKDKGMTDPCVVSTDQLDFIKKGVQKCLGIPNLNYFWWSQ